MKRNLLAAALAVCAVSAQADSFSFEGTGARLYNWWACRCERPVGGESFAWLGRLEVDNPATEGSFAGVTWSLISNVYSASGRAGYGVVSEGALTSFAFADAFAPQFAVTGMQGISLDYFARFDDRLQASASLQPMAGQRLAYPVPPVPEPEAWALILAGLALTARLARRTK